MANEKTDINKVVFAVMIFVITAWLGWVSLSAIAYDKRLSVVESVISYIQGDIQEIKGLLKEVRDNQKHRGGDK